MKIILIDNFDRELYADIVIAEKLNDDWGAKIVKLLNDKYSGTHTDVFFKLVTDEHKLFEGFKP